MFGWLAQRFLFSSELPENSQAGNGDSEKEAARDIRDTRIDQRAGPLAPSLSCSMSPFSPRQAVEQYNFEKSERRGKEKQGVKHVQVADDFRRSGL